MADEQIIAKPYFAGTEAALDSVLIDQDMTAVNSGIPDQIAPTAIRPGTGWPRKLYERVYYGRAEVENRIKELHHGLEINPPSCSAFMANQLRVLPTAAAYVLMQELRLSARGNNCARAQVSTLRERLLKLGVWVESSVRRIVLHLPLSFVYRNDGLHIARRVGPAPT